ncbi:MAG: putative tRNA-dihydrouridine synthase [Candidatus Magnetoglobus multicellularis str. Araruama]|uniref:tRNA-dihydrouridine synthase n=1 Tax=Candidatus Magnetoglobus multicellularis str. Araruama TaxID=890399 RepID=A0A1V1PC68_9BACT|nr:MAG: putative tRNA-dihydrouridine synthase [Candidatus Magnetoglobus multicellularis str. Araruama]
MKIGHITLTTPFILAPLAGITNLPFRMMVKSYGCGLVCSEMISANGLVHESPKTMDYLQSDRREKPVSFQIFGAKPDIMAEAAKIVQSKGADILDVNLGCSVRKVLKTGAGAALMKDYQLAASIFQSIRKAINIPFTIKIRSGWDASGNDAIEIGQIAESCGVDAITIHPRTARQGFGGQADWSIIRRLKQQVNIPVIGNGDIHSAASAFQMISETQCDAVMIGREAVHNPWLFQDIVSRYQKVPSPKLSLHERFDAICDYVDQSIAHMGERRACRLMRSRLGWFTRGLPNSCRFRESIRFLETRQQTFELLMNYYKTICSME